MKKAFAILVAGALVGCGGGSDAADEPMPDAATTEAAAPAGTVTITAPADGSTVAGPSVTVTLASTVTIVPAGDATPGSGHHHILLDADIGDDTAPIPPTEGGIVHMGDGSSEYTFENVAPGEHRLIAVVADFAHVPLQPLVVDTVTFTVTGN